jgi:hypothetical protein
MRSGAASLAAAAAAAPSRGSRLSLTVDVDRSSSFSCSIVNDGGKGPLLTCLPPLFEDGGVLGELGSDP